MRCRPRGNRHNAKAQVGHRKPVRCRPGYVELTRAAGTSAAIRPAHHLPHHSRAPRVTAGTVGSTEWRVRDISSHFLSLSLFSRIHIRQEMAQYRHHLCKPSVVHPGGVIQRRVKPSPAQVQVKAAESGGGDASAEEGESRAGALYGDVISSEEVGKSGSIPKFINARDRHKQTYRLLIRYLEKAISTAEYLETWEFRI